MFKVVRFWIKSWFIKEHLDADAVSKISFRVMPWDCDPNMHMTNSRYFYYMDFARFWRLTHMGKFKQVMVKRGWRPMAVSQEITYINDIAPFEKFEIYTQVVSWDDKYLYYTQDIYGKKGLCAKAMVRSLFVKNRKPVPIKEVMEFLGNQSVKSDYQDRITAWKQVLDYKKQENMHR